MSILVFASKYVQEIFFNREIHKICEKQMKNSPFRVFCGSQSFVPF